MKNSNTALVLIVITGVVGLISPIESLKANEPFVTDCYHEHNGVLVNNFPYASFQGQGTCPSPPEEPESEPEPAAAPQTETNDNPEDPPFICQIIHVIEQ